MNIDKLKIKGNLFLAPMSNVTNLPFRLLCKKYGASLVYSEMINCDAYLMENKKTKKRTRFLEQERPIGIQIFGSCVEKLKKASKKIEKQIKPDLIDINIGCPAYNVMKTGSGASLLKNPDKISEIVKELSFVLTIPLTCKIRILPSEKNTIRIAQTIEKSGASALAVHGRTARQGYSGNANWNIIKKIKKELTIPVILNGDVVDEISAEKALKKTKCDGIMIGRAAIGNPYIFKRIKHYLKTEKKLEKLSFEDRINSFFEYVELCEKYDFLDLKKIKTQANNFIKGVDGCKKIRKKIAKTKDIKQIKLILRNEHISKSI